jgi:hypothetical protein
MKFLKFWNKFFFNASFNIFDLLVIITVVYLMTTYSWWWGLIYIPTTVFSVWMQLKVDKND